MKVKRGGEEPIQEQAEVYSSGSSDLLQLLQEDKSPDASSFLGV